MCGTCGCSDEAVTPVGQKRSPGVGHYRLVDVERNVMEKNQAYADKNRGRFERQGQLAINLLSSPGSGKTSLLVRTLNDLAGQYAFSVIEGDQQSHLDADRIRATGAPAVQINTGKGCHLDAHRVGHACEELASPRGGVIFIENVGNLVCPAAFDLGETSRVVVLSVTEGEDKPIKYPDMFAGADLVLINKSDLLPFLDFDLDACVENVQKARPGVRVLTLSVTGGEGMEAWYDWIARNHRSVAGDGVYAREAT